RRTDKALQLAGRTRLCARAGERPIFRRRHIPDAASASRSIRPGCKSVSQWRWSFSIAIHRHDVGWPGAIYTTWFENLLLQQWIPAMPDVKAHLQRGCDVADVGCGRGRGIIKLAEAFPRSRYVGFDNFGPTVAQATENAREAGVSDRVRFEERD